MARIKSLACLPQTESKVLATTFLSLSADLASARTLAAKKKLTAEMSKFLAEDKEFAGTLIRPVIMSALNEVNELRDIITGEFFKLRHQVYTDSDNKIKIAVGVVFLQDHDNSNINLDQIVLDFLIEDIKSKNLDLLVNDVTVNVLQARDGSTASLL